jgi:FkbM family methyltransferase
MEQSSEAPDSHPLVAAGTRVVDTLASTVGGTPLGTTARRLGLADTVVDARNRLTGVFLPDELVVRVGDDSYRFHLSTAFEYEQFLAYESSPDGTVLRGFAADLQPDDVVWDVGANVGIFSVVGASMADSVVAFEPIPSNVTRIRENLTLNGNSATIQRLALSDSNDGTQLAVSSPSGTGAFGIVGNGDGREMVSVRTAPGDDLVSGGLPAPTVLKIDVQGAELAVLSGLSESLDGCRVVYCNVYEKHFVTGSEDDRIHTLLEARGFDVTEVGSWSGGYFLRATRPE